MPNLPKVPLESWISEGVNWLTTHLSGLFNLMQRSGQSIMDGLTNGLTAIPMPLMIAGLTVIAILTTPKKYGFPLFMVGLDEYRDIGYYGVCYFSCNWYSIRNYYC